MRRRLVLVGIALALGAALLFLLVKERSADAPGDPAISGRATAGGGLAPVSGASKPPHLASAAEPRPSPNADTSTERRPVSVEELLRHGSKEPLIAPVLELEVDFDPSRSPPMSLEPLVPKEIHVEVNPSGRGGRVTNEPLVPPVIHLDPP